ncbi:MAG: pimeloyl-ACP methyl ester esterase BioH [Gammaproteobacteria bacterium]|nr:pimeloyl-ACP methyl ester esterase BioH [Gammaproteobacteria bacterium]
MNTNTGLYSASSGEGEPLVLLHGWGMHSGIWGEFAEELAKTYQVIKIDLPGHGKSEMTCPLTLDETARQILRQVPQAAHFIGWSLGGSVLMHLAAIAPDRVRSMILLTTSPCFVQQTGWSSAMKAEVLEDFAKALEQNYRKTLLQFIALQTLSCQQSKESLKKLRKQVFAYGEPDRQALQQGLDILMHADLRDEFFSTNTPCFVLLGERDQLVPVSIAGFYDAVKNNCKVEVIAGAGHVPFVSHLAVTLKHVKGFLEHV